MGLPNGITSCFSKLSLSPKVTALESTIQQSLEKYKDLRVDIENLYIESEYYKTEFNKLKEKCESKNCVGAETLRKVVESKENIIQLVASVLTKLNESKDFDLLTQAFQILCGEITAMTPPKNSQEQTKGEMEIVQTPKNKLTFKKEPSSSIIEDDSFKNESVSEIEDTPTGRKSPIIQPKKSRSSSIVDSPDMREKKKSSDKWPTSQSKMVKLVFPNSVINKSGKGKLKQQRFKFDYTKPSTFVDLTSSPEARPAGDHEECALQKLIKKESSENDETILPSPTSGLTAILLPRTNKGSQNRFKRPMLSLKNKCENTTNNSALNEENKPAVEAMDTENSIVLEPRRFSKKQSPVKEQFPPDTDVTNCEPDTSMSVLRPLIKQENHIIAQDLPKANSGSQDRRPLAENINFLNLPSPPCELQSSPSLLVQDPQLDYVNAVENNAKRKTPQKVEPLYKEPTVRNKAEKMALPAWCCEECKKFYGILYKDEPEKIAEVIANCSKHRGRTNPARPRTPTNFWNPRWDVPDDTEEFNKRNNVE